MGLPRTNPDGSVTLRSSQSGSIVTVAGVGQLPVDYSQQREWYIAEGGNDAGPGTASAPLATGAELSRRLVNVIEPETTTVYYMTDAQPTDYLMGPAGCAPGAGFLVRPLGELPLLGEVTVTAFQAGSVATNARNRVTVAGQPNWAAALQNQYFDVVNKPGLGGYVDKVDPADNTRAFISDPFNPSTAGFAALAPGDVLRFTQRRLIGQGLWLATGGRSVLYPGAAYPGDVRDMRVEDTGNGQLTSNVVLGEACYAARCQFNAYNIKLGFLCQLDNCDLSGAAVPFSAGQIQHIGQTFILGGFARRRFNWYGPGLVQILGMTFSDNLIEVSDHLEFDCTSRSTSIWDWTGGPAYNFEPTTFLNERVRLYGLSAAAGTYGFSFETGSGGHYQGGVPNVIGVLGTGGAGTKDLEIGGDDRLYAGLPHFNPVNLTAFVVRFST